MPGNYPITDDVELHKGDVIRVECSWDRHLFENDLNASRNQAGDAMVQGFPQFAPQPHDVTWAEGTEDEMFLDDRDGPQRLSLADRYGTVTESRAHRNLHPRGFEWAGRGKPSRDAPRRGGASRLLAQVSPSTSCSSSMSTDHPSSQA